MIQRFVCICALLLGSVVVFAQAKFEEGKHYDIVPVPFEAEPKGLPIQVVEVFSYACPHCYDFEKPLQKVARETKSRRGQVPTYPRRVLDGHGELG